MSIAGLLNQEITLYTKVSYNSYGREVPGSGTVLNARIQKTNKQKLLPNNSMITIEVIAYVPGGTVVAIDDKITYDAVNYKVYGVYTAVDGAGKTHHKRLDLIKWAQV